MQTWRQMDPQGAKLFQDGVVVIGNFDGLHIGHQALLKEARALTSGPCIVLTFDPHPIQVLYPERNLKRILPREDLLEQLPLYGIDLLVIIPFTRPFAQLSADEFLAQYVEPFHPRHIVAGYDFAFGRDREGSLDRLRSWGSQRRVDVRVMPALELGGEVASSRRLRELIAQGRVDEAAVLLGRPFFVRGQVVRGAGRGVGLGFPTLNLKANQETWPAPGVYATRTLWQGRTYNSVTNVGRNPTFESGQEIKVETHVLDAKIEARDDQIKVEFIAFLRPEKKFPSSHDLARQIQNDILRARQILGAR